MAVVEIYCPKCEWHPTDADRWMCRPGCDTIWNTFLTRGLCPGCGRRWSVTQCHRCLAVSLHEDWYHYPEESSRRQRRGNKIKQTA
jgi:hypothetical protein